MIVPANVILETSALCNVSCLGCALHGPHRFVTRDFGHMPRSVWEPVVREIGSWNTKVSLATHGGGEPLLNPQLMEILKLANSFPNLETGFLTNGMLLDEAWADFLTDVELDWVAFSIDGVSPKTHDKVRRGSDLLRVEQNLMTLLRMKKDKGTDFPHVKLNMVAYDSIKDQRDAFVEKWVDRVEAVMISHYRNPPDSKRWPGVPEKRQMCNLLWSQVIIAWDGRIGLCCEDFNIDFSLGRIGDDGTLLELWNGAEISKVRKLHEQGQFDQHPMCRVCDTWAEGYVRKETVDRGITIVTTPSQTVYFR